MRKYGLIGFPLGHSFSKKYFTEKFEKEEIADAKFELFEIPKIEDFENVILENPDLLGLSVTIPYKQAVIRYLDELDSACSAIGAVNCIQVLPGKLRGFNTDYIGFKTSLTKWLDGEKPKALILGTGGASKAVKQVLVDMGIQFQSVSRSAGDKLITYEDLAKKPAYLEEYKLIINTTPLGTYPKTDEMPEIPLDQLTSSHWVYDLVYNPAETALMNACLAKGGKAKNGLEMLENQAEAAWKIWNPETKE